MKTNQNQSANSSPNPYPPGFVYGRGVANPRSWSLSGLKIKRALRALRAVQGEVLELGCGGGQYLRALRRARPKQALAAVDLDPQALRCVEDIAEVQGTVADVQALPFKDQRFAAVMGFDILEHVNDPKRVLTESARVLVPGGILHMYVPCEGNSNTIYVKKGHVVKAKFGGHQQQYTTQQLIDLLKDSGFEILRQRHADYFITQQFDYMFFNRVARSNNPQALWAAQALQTNGGLKGWCLRQARRVLSVITWLEGSIRHSARGAMGVHVTARKRQNTDWKY
ncbi:class I SAM-dependent methyltransferase [bacterium]|nr:class I SAM-dependent methyltransferase [bacterium]